MDLKSQIDTELCGEGTLWVFAVIFELLSLREHILVCVVHGSSHVLGLVLVVLLEFWGAWRDLLYS